MSTKEEWRDVVEWEGVYQISSVGRVRRTGRNRGARVGRILAQMSKRGYLLVRLHDNGRCVLRPVHQLVVAAFVGPCPKGYEVNHKNGKKSDNRLMNLEYITHRANVIHGLEVVGRVHAKGSKHGMSKLTEEQVKKIKDMLRAEIYTMKAIADAFGVSESAVRSIFIGRTWKHIA